MYLPEHFRVDDREALLAFVGRHPFATLITTGDGGLELSHLPFLLERRPDGQAALLGHLARANPHARSLDGREARVLFQGPHGYVSPSWYEEAQAVPTWNYAAVHVSGVVRLIEGAESLLGLLARLVEVHEARLEQPWSLDREDAWTRRLVSGIVGFEIPVTAIEGKFKLSQNRPEASQRRVVRNLAESADAGDRDLAALMAEVLGHPLRAG